MRRNFAILAALMALVLTNLTTLRAQETEPAHSGFLDSVVPFKAYTLPLQAGDHVLLRTQQTSGSLDTVLTVETPDGAFFLGNDDRAEGTLDSLLAFVAPTTGSYTVRVNRFPEGDNSGEFELYITTGTDDSIFAPVPDLTRIKLSGPMQSLLTRNFRIHYTLEGADATTEAYARLVAQTMEAVWYAQIVQMRWTPPPRDGFLGGDNRIDVYLRDLRGEGEGNLGWALGDLIVGDNPLSSEVETEAASGFLVLDRSYADADEFEKTPDSLLRSVAAHEFNHVVQFGFDRDDEHNWIYEATASWIETTLPPSDEAASFYLNYAWQYPELCFGTISDPSGLLQYGEWPFIASLADAHGVQAVVEVWRSLAKFEGFEALTQTLSAYGTTLPDAVAAYRLRNLARDYPLATAVEATVWLEQTITDLGRWTFTGAGIQELGGNYFAFDLEPGAYYAGLLDESGDTLQLWAAVITGESLKAILLGRGGSFDTTGADYAYLMVFNPRFDENVDECIYEDYEIEVTEAKGALIAPTLTWNARYFVPLR